MVRISNELVYFNLTHKRLIFNLDIPKLNINIAIDTKPTQVITGLSSKCQDGNNVILLDYDIIKWNTLLMDLIVLSKKYNLRLYTIFMTKETDNDTSNYSVIFYDKRTFHEALRILDNSKCDRNYIHNCEKRSSKDLVIRISRKSNRPIQYCTTIWNRIKLNQNYQELKLSYAHFNFIKQLLTNNSKALEELTSFEKNIMFDKSHKINLVSYATAGK